MNTLAMDDFTKRRAFKEILSEILSQNIYQKQFIKSLQIYATHNTFRVERLGGFQIQSARKKG
jgi:hypothetical protein